MVHAKNIWVQILGILALVITLWFCIRVGVEAADSVLQGTFESDGKTYNYYLTSQIDLYKNDRYILSFTFSNDVYLLPCCVSDGDFYFYAYSFDSFTFTQSGFSPNKCYFDENNDIYWCMIATGSFNTIPESNQLTSNESVGTIALAFRNYLVSDDFDDLLLVSPEWRKAQYKSFSLNTFTASLADGNIIAEWNGVSPAAVNLIDNDDTYVRVTFGLIPDGSVDGLVKRGVTWDDTFTFADNGFSILLEDVEIPEGCRLWYVSAIPYYEVESVSGTVLYQGNASYVYFDADGVASATVEKAPSELPEEVADETFSLWNSITNFFGSFFTNFFDMIRDAVIPSEEDLMLLLTEMNDWFSDRLGFIWYPFDLAVQLVAALAGGEANTMFKVPALTLNMLGGVTLWEAFEFDIDAFGILKYVRFFTGTVIVSQTVRLAIVKWDEWIGGHDG